MSGWLLVLCARPSDVGWFLFGVATHAAGWLASHSWWVLQSYAMALACGLAWMAVSGWLALGLRGLAAPSARRRASRVFARTMAAQGSVFLGLAVWQLVEGWPMPISPSDLSVAAAILWPCAMSPTQRRAQCLGIALAFLVGAALLLPERFASDETDLPYWTVLPAKTISADVVEEVIARKLNGLTERVSAVPPQVPGTAQDDPVCP